MSKKFQVCLDMWNPDIPVVDVTLVRKAWMSLWVYLEQQTYTFVSMLPLAN